ncbi:hypothetical protein EMEDMD4_270167 [Sinorhizobium medicae]|uniref:Uncharacterized protein n=1 Tax=Sinorhizobium medicae TaxID=110321 RepID=A0A508X0Q2_9HYPH|nr:hypothetical protein EMEDMD4_270167 [Sinorhizobium medicae]
MNADICADVRLWCIVDVTAPPRLYQTRNARCSSFNGCIFLSLIGCD